MATVDLWAAINYEVRDGHSFFEWRTREHSRRFNWRGSECRDTCSPGIESTAFKEERPREFAARTMHYDTSVADREQRVENRRTRDITSPIVPSLGGLFTRVGYCSNVRRRKLSYSVWCGSTEASLSLKRLVSGISPPPLPPEGSSWDI